MNNSLLNIEIQDFINNNLKSNINTLLLKGTTFSDAQTREIVEQIESKNRCYKKLPTWFNTKNIYYPNKLNIEQTSSEITANYKSQLIYGDSIIDLTGGLGVDTFYFSKYFKTITHCEINTTLSTIAKHNFIQLKGNIINSVNTDGIEYLIHTKKTYDWVFVDPSRRTDSKEKVFMLKDCQPNLPDQIDVIFEYTNQILIKTSPLLDITLGTKELKYTKEIHIIAVNNEVKELLWVLKKGYSKEISIHTINITKEESQEFKFKLNSEQIATSEYSLPLTYLYEPNTAILKSGGFNTVANHYDLKKLQKHSHLYSSDKLVDFPGRRFEIKSVIPYNKRKELKIKKANITTRNFPENVQYIRKKTKIKDGGDIYIFATTLNDETKVLIKCSKI